MIKILKYLDKKQWCFAAMSILFIVCQVWIDLKLPDYMANITTLVQTEGSAMSDILIQGGYMLLCALSSMLAAMIVGYFAAKIAAGLAKTLREKIYDKTLSFSMGEMSHFSTESLINRTTNDITQIQTIIAMGLQAIVKAPILAVWAIIKISGKTWQWTTATIIAVFVLMIMMAAILIFAVPRFKKIQTLTDKINLVTREHLTGIRVVRAYNADKYQEKKFASANDDLTLNNLTANRVMALMSPGMTLINSGLTLAVYWIGAYLINAANLTSRLGLFSDMVVFSNYAMQVIMAFMLLNMIFILLPRAQVSANRINEVLETESHIHDGITFDNTTEKGTIEFKDVSFQYPEASDCVLKNISFKVNQGETVAIIGSTGSGKSSLINLIPRFYDVSSGEVLINGRNVKEFRLNDLHNHIGYISQKAMLFSGTVFSNVAYGDNGKEEKDEVLVKKAISIAQSTDFVEKMDGQYKGAISQNGTNVSGGQKQRLSIARAIAHEPDIFIFDDSFSALDYKTDKILRKELDKETKNTTKIIVAQRIGTILHADQIIVLDHGKVIGKGTHKELLETCPTYQEIAYSQLSKEELENE